ncbi:protein C2-DOMAIN ABA-RELATED 7-like [Populus alba x Populus x berolinensis]|nr:protein C2-DOMAIN ABA-RELATED 7-like [Populus alba x Populus x berolinensis]
MDSFLGLLRIRVKRGVNLAVRDLGSSDPYVVITMGNQTVFDKDTFTVDDKMGEARIDIQPYIASLKMGLQNLPKGCVVSRVQPSQNNCLADESCIVWDDGKLLQDMILRLRNVESGEVTIQIEWIDVPGCRGLKTEGTG